MSSLWPLWTLALVLLLLTLGGLLWPLLREPSGRPGAEPDPHESLRRLYRAKRDELEREHQRQALDTDDYTQAVEELERRLLEELDKIENSPRPAPEGVWRRHLPAMLISVLLPLSALALYLHVGDPRAAATLASGTPATHAGAGMNVEAMVARLEQRLSEEPGNLDGWIMLARSREVMREFELAATAYQHAVTLAAQQKMPASVQARLHADLADAMASARGGAFDASVQSVLKAALVLDADQPKALALAGVAALSNGDLAGARRHWQRLLNLLEPNSEMALRVQNDLARLDTEIQSPVPKTTPAASLAGTVRLAPALRDRVQPGDTVFIVARSPLAGRMPVAVLRFPAAQLPADFTLNDSNAMSPDMPLSRFDEFTVEARISRSGTAQRQPGQPVSPLLPARRGSKGLDLLIGSLEP